MATVKKYNPDVTWNMPAAQAMQEGYLYGVNASGQAVLADRATGPKAAVGFALRSGSAADVTIGKAFALCPMGIVDCVAADIAGGAFTVGGQVYLDVTGKYTTTKPSTAAQILQGVGVALTTTKVLVNITSYPLTLQAAGTTTIAP